jgi:hypothetical protein
VFGKRLVEAGRHVNLKLINNAGSKKWFVIIVIILVFELVFTTPPKSLSNPHLNRRVTLCLNIDFETVEQVLQKDRCAKKESLKEWKKFGKQTLSKHAAKDRKKVGKVMNGNYFQNEFFSVNEKAADVEKRKK